MTPDTDLPARSAPPQSAADVPPAVEVSSQALHAAQAVQAVGTGEVDALFISDAAGRRLITLHGADRAYRLLLEDMADGALTLTADGVVAWCNRSFAALLARPLNRLIGTGVDLCFAPEGRASLATMLAEARHGRRHLALDLLTDQGLRMPVHVSVNPSVVEGLPEALCMVVTDLTQQTRSAADKLSRQHLLAVIDDQRRTQQHLQDSLATLRLRDRALDAISQGVLISDAQQNITYVNAAFEAMSGYTAADMLGRSCSFLQGPQTDAQMVQLMRSALDASQPFRGEILNYRRDGEPFWNDLSITPVLDSDGELAQFVGVQRDVTRRKLSERAALALGAQLREAQKMEAIGTLAGGIAHDFNNILGSMLGNLGLARQTLGAGHEAHALLDQVRSAGRRACSLIEQILAFSRRQPTTLKAQSLEPVVREALDLLRATLPAHVQLELTVQPGSQPIILGDTTQLQQVVVNLCTNAWQALAGSMGRIAVNIDAVQVDLDVNANADGAAPVSSALPPGNYVHLSVTDTGAGMDAATRARIFDPFFTTKGPGQGTGLGLSVVDGIVASHHGHIAVCSNPGSGTTFDLHFPATDAEPGEVTQPAPLDAAPQGQGQRVLYIDDDEVMLLMVSQLLEHLGYRPTCLSDPRLAIARVQAAPKEFDAVITDYNMPPMSGLDVARALRGIDAGLPVAISSGFISDALRQDGAELGVVALMRKEFTMEELAVLVSRLLAHKEAGHH